VETVCPVTPARPKSSPNASRLTVWRAPFDRYAEDYGKHPVDDAYDMETLKDFVKKIAYGIEGRDGIAEPSLKSVIQAWKDFRADFRRLHEPIPRNTTLSVTNVRIPALAAFHASLSHPNLQIPAFSAFLLPLLPIFRIEKADWATVYQGNPAEAAQPSPTEAQEEICYRESLCPLWQAALGK